MSEGFKYNRRRFLGTAAMTFVASEFALADLSEAKPHNTNPGDETHINLMSNNSFETIKQINAGLLNVGYAESGPSTGTPVILLHGWPYDIYSFADVAALLSSVGYRVIVPYLRGYGTTSFISGETVRNGQQSVVAIDTINLMDALKIDKAIIGGFDW